MGPNGTCPERDFFGKLTIILLRCNVPPSYYISKYLDCELQDVVTWDIRLHIFLSKLGPNCTTVLKQVFVGKLTNATFVNLLCPIILKCFMLAIKLKGKFYDKN